MKDLDRKMDKLERKLEESIGKSITSSETNVMEAVEIVINRKLQVVYTGWVVLLIGLLIISYFI